MVVLAPIWPALSKSNVKPSPEQSVSPGNPVLKVTSGPSLYVINWLINVEVHPAVFTTSSSSVAFADISPASIV